MNMMEAAEWQEKQQRTTENRSTFTWWLRVENTNYALINGHVVFIWPNSQYGTSSIIDSNIYRYVYRNNHNNRFDFSRTMKRKKMTPERVRVCDLIIPYFRWCQLSLDGSFPLRFIARMGIFEFYLSFLLLICNREFRVGVWKCFYHHTRSYFILYGLPCLSSWFLD